MANIRLADVADGVEEKISREILDYWKQNTVMPQLIRRDFDTELATDGQVVSVNTITELTVKDKVAATDYEAERITSSKTQITLDKHKYVGFVIEDLAKFLAKPDYVASLMDQGVKRIIEQIESDILALYSGVTTSSVGTAGTDVTPDLIVDARKKLSDQKVPQGNRSLVLSTKDIAALLKQEKFTSSNWAQSNGAALAEANLGRKYGFNIFELQGIKTGAGSPTPYYNLAFHKDAFCLASRPLRSPDAGTGTSARILNADGIALRVMISYDHAKGGHFVTIDVLYGVKTLREKGACLVTS